MTGLEAATKGVRTGGSQTFISYYWLSSGDLRFKMLSREAVQKG
jgi:hypothetical protein